MNNSYAWRVGSIDGSSSVYRSFADFQVDRFDSYQIGDAELTLFQYGAKSCSAQPMSVQPIKSAFVQNGSGATLWASHDPLDATARVRSSMVSARCEAAGSDAGSALRCAAGAGVAGGKLLAQVHSVG